MRASNSRQVCRPKAACTDALTKQEFPTFLKGRGKFAPAAAAAAGAAAAAAAATAGGGSTSSVTTGSAGAGAASSPRWHGRRERDAR
jgi:hypothetical protein